MTRFEDSLEFILEPIPRVWTIPSDQTQLHSSRHSVQRWSHLDFWSESERKEKC